MLPEHNRSNSADTSEVNHGPHSGNPVSQALGLGGLLRREAVCVNLVAVVSQEYYHGYEQESCGRACCNGRDGSFTLRPGGE
jgi:hypothetical protein